MPVERSAELFADLVVPTDSAGVDEVGRGPLAGPVVAGAVVLPARHGITGLRDSKRLSAKQRDALADEIKAAASGWAIGIADVAEIDSLNILRASHLAMQRAVARLCQQPSVVLVDGNQLPSFAVPAVAVVKGDARVAQISAAAILAKVERDGMMAAMDQQYPHYGFAQHKGYGTAKHLAALAQHGPCPEHRRSFAPVRAAVPAAPSPSAAPLFEEPA